MMLTTLLYNWTNITTEILQIRRHKLMILTHCVRVTRYLVFMLFLLNR